MKRIILCADDYGQTQTISQAIIDLLKCKRLSATSRMVTSACWPMHANWLVPYATQCDIGLHFNLTEGKSVSVSGQVFQPLSHVIFKSHLRLLNKKNILAELHAQLDHFVEHMGVLPDFIDGHQHVHQLPVVRDALFEVYEERLRDKGCYLRCIYRPDDLWDVKGVAYIKKLVLQWTGAIAFKKELVKRNIPHNVSFSGIYGFDERHKYARLFELFLKDISTSGLIMCHPGLEDSFSEDVIRYARFKEYDFLKSEEFMKVLDRHQVSIVRFKELYK